MYPKFNRIYYFLLADFGVLITVTAIITGLYLDNLLPEQTAQILIYSFGATSLVSFLTLFGFLLWERWTEVRSPRSQLKFTFLNSILATSDSCLVLMNKACKIIWSNDWTRLRTILNHKNAFYFNLNRISPAIGNLKRGQTHTFVQDYGNYKNQYTITLIEKKLLLIHAKTLEYQVSQFFLKQKWIFFVLTLDKIGSNLHESSFERSETQILTEIQLELYRQMQEFDVLIFNSNRFEWLLIMSNEQLQKFRYQNFRFINNIEKKIKKKFDLVITFSIGAHLGHQSLFQDVKTLQFNDFNIAETYQKTLAARRMAQSRGGDQIILTQANEAFNVYGKQRDFLELDTSNIKNFYQIFLNKLQLYQNIIILGHKSADLDVFGAGVALSFFLKKLFSQRKKVAFFVNDVAKQTLDFVKTNLGKTLFQRYVNWQNTKKLQDLLTSQTVLIIIDTNNLQFVDAGETSLESFDKIFIDHHINRFSGNPVLDLVDPNFSSTSEIALSLMIHGNSLRKTEAQLAFDPNILKLVLLGILSDTNNLQSQIGKDTLRIVNFIMRNGVRIEETIVAINHFKIASAQMININSKDFVTHLIDKKRVVLQFRDDHLVNSQTVAALAEKYLSNRAVDLVLAIGQGQNNQIFISGRSLAPHNVEVLCKEFGGGGDVRRSAAQISSLEWTLNQVTDKLKKDIAAQTTN